MQLIYGVKAVVVAAKPETVILTEKRKQIFFYT